MNTSTNGAVSTESSNLSKSKLTRLAGTRNRSLKFELVSDNMIDFGPEEAEAYLNLESVSGERKVSDRDVQSLVDHMSGGTYNEASVMVASAIMRGTHYKINGQHTAWAVSYKGDPIRVRRTIYRVNNENQLKALYGTYDSGKPRTRQHVLKALLVDAPFTEGVGLAYLGLVANSFRQWRYPDAVAFDRVLPQQLAVTIERDYAELFQTVGVFFSEAVNVTRVIQRTAVIAAMFATFHKDGELALEFWSPVVDRVGLDSRNDPRWRLADFLDKTTLSSRGNNKNLRKVTAAETYNACIAAWNKWRSGEEMASSIRLNSKRPEVL